MRLKPSALAVSHAQSHRLAGAGSLHPRPRSLLFGRGHRLNRPLMALTTEQNLGACRHALAQRTVAGSLIVHFPPPPIPTRT